MTDLNIYNDIAVRTGGAFLLGVVGPVRTGKSTFIKKFMETMIIPNIENEFERERARDELPQSGSGRMIMTAEPKFVPENAVNILLGENTALSVRLVDCVGYMVDGAAGQYENGEERLVATPWFDSEVTMTKAAEEGTRKVIREHSTVGIVITTDGSFGEIPREKFIEPEERVISELKELGKPFVVLVNSADPEGDSAKSLAGDIGKRYGVSCISVNCAKLGEEDINRILVSALEDFPLRAVGVFLPEWLEALPDQYDVKSAVLEEIMNTTEGASAVRDAAKMAERLNECDNISSSAVDSRELDKGVVYLSVNVPRSMYYETISRQTGLAVTNDADIIGLLTEMSAIREDYGKISSALNDVRTKGYGVVLPSVSQMTLEEPQIVRQNGRYTVKLKASAPAIHMLQTTVETEVTPQIGGASASEEIISFLLQGFDGDVNRIWESNIFGKSLNDIAEDGLYSKLESLPENAKNKLKLTLQRIVNEGSGGLICILL